VGKRKAYIDLVASAAIRRGWVSNDAHGVPATGLERGLQGLFRAITKRPPRLPSPGRALSKAYEQSAANFPAAEDQHSFYVTRCVGSWRHFEPRLLDLCRRRLA